MAPLRQDAHRVGWAETGTLADALREEARNMSLSRFGDDHKEAVAAFVEKRTPKFVGH